MVRFFQKVNGSLKFRIKKYLGLINLSSNYTKEFLGDNQNCIVGDYTYGQPRIKEWGEGTKLIIGKFCSIAYNVEIFLGGNHRTDWVSTYPFNVMISDFPLAQDIKGHPLSKGNVIIGNDVWIGQNAVILSGVTIGDGAVIGANSVVSKNIGPYEVWAGNPAKFIKKRFQEKQIESLLKIKWWDWPNEKIKSNVHLLCDSNIDSFIIKFLDLPTD